MLLIKKIEYLKKEKKKIYNFIIIRKILPYLILKKIYPYLKKKSHLFINNNKHQIFKKVKRNKINNNGLLLNNFVSKNLVLNVLYYYLFLYKNKLEIKNKINKKKNYFFYTPQNNLIKNKSNNIIIRILATTRNVIISGFSHNNKLEFIYSMAAIKNQNNLKRKTFFACKLLVEKLLHFYLYKRNLFRMNNRIIFILYGYNKFYNLIFRVIAQNRIFYSGLIFKNNIPHNGCFKKKKKRK